MCVLRLNAKRRALFNGVRANPDAYIVYSDVCVLRIE